MTPIYTYPIPTPALEEALYQALLALGRRESHLDSFNRPILVDGFRYDTNTMLLVKHIADEGGVVYRDRSPHARALSRTLGYTAVANLMACVREAVNQGLITASILDNEGWLMVSDYGFEQLELWEGME